MHEYKCIIAYDGTNYQGWQVQPHGNTVANILQNTYQHVFSEPIKIIGASRTDAGVHARHQVASFSSQININPNNIKSAWNNTLPSDISILSLCEQPNFHPQRNVIQKTYWYHFTMQRPLPFYARYCLFYRFPLSLDRLMENLTIFRGTHDFRSFCTGNEHENTIRTIDDISINFLNQWNLYRIECKGKAFLYHMIRRIVGASLHGASHDAFSPEKLRSALEQKNPEQQLPTAPAAGLMLANIIYENNSQKDEYVNH